MTQIEKETAEARRVKVFIRSHQLSHRLVVISREVAGKLLSVEHDQKASWLANLQSIDMNRAVDIATMAAEEAESLVAELESLRRELWLEEARDAGREARKSIGPHVDLSGEWAGAGTGKSLSERIVGDGRLEDMAPDEAGELVDELCDAWEAGRDEQP